MSTTEIIGTLDKGVTERAIRATAETQHDSWKQEVAVAIDTLARGVAASGDHAHQPQSWRPPAEQVTERHPAQAAEELRPRVFQSWVREVRTAILHEAPVKA